MSGTKARRTEEERVLNIARAHSMRTFEDLYAEPPPYSPRSPPAASDSSTQDASSWSLPKHEELDFQSSPLEIPTPAECIAHLKLLHAFAKLRHEIGNHDGLFGISMETVDAKDMDTHTMAERIRDKRWSVFVTKAVARFEKWWDTLTGMSTWYAPIRTDDFETASESPYAVQRFPVTGDGYEKNSNFRLPPLDVLMVWHAYMLNPRTYLEDSVRYTKQTLWRTCFPWGTIYQSIDNETLDYSSGDTAHFRQMTGCWWDPLQDKGLATVKCPRCCEVGEVPWTQPPAHCGPEELEIYLSYDTGFAGSEFEHMCSHCNLIVTHEKLRVGKFCDDGQALLDCNRPFAGTILNAWGEPAGTTEGKKLGTHDAFFPHRIIECKSEFKPTAIRAQVDRLTINTIKSQFESLLRSHTATILINAQQKRPEFIAKGSRVAVRKVLSHYWDNSSVFGIDLTGAVLRQGTFVQKMTKLDWLHSPNVMSTVPRLIVKYHRFVRLAAENPKKTVVPTLDIDLAWHTHQLTPRTYYRYTLAETKKFLNHDDKIPETNLHTSFQWTSHAYEKKYAQPYSECSCWYCECTREPLRSSFLSKLSTRKSLLSIDRLEAKGFTKDAHMGPHVSAHNAVVLTNTRTAVQKRRELEELDVQYAKVCKRYQKQKAAQAPKRDSNDVHVSGAYGYPIYYPGPTFVPYYADAGACEHANADAQGAGSCAAGTCCNSTSLGACAGGNGTPGCAASCGGHGGADGGCGTCGGGSGGDGGGGGCGGGGGGD